MEIQMTVVCSQLLQIMALLAVGYLSICTRLLPASVLDAFAKYIMNIALPAMLIYQIPQTANRALLLDALPLLIVAFLTYGALLLMGYGAGRLLRYEKGRMRINMVQTAIGNYAVIGIPVISSMIGDAAGVYLVVIMLIDQIYLNLVAFPLTLPAENGQRLNISLLKRLLNPLAIAMLAALGMIMLDIFAAEESVVGYTLSSIVGGCKSLSIIFLGGMLATLHIKEKSCLLGAFLTVFLRMLLMPLVVYSIAGYFPISCTGRQVLSLTVALPSVLSVVAMTRVNGTDSEYATVGVCTTTLCYPFTLPIVVWCLNRMT